MVSANVSFSSDQNINRNHPLSKLKADPQRDPHRLIDLIWKTEPTTKSVFLCRPEQNAHLCVIV